MIPTALQETETSRVAGQVLEPHQQWVALALAATMLVVVFELVRRRKLREEYSVIWTVTAFLLMLVAWQQDLLALFADVIGAKEAPSALFFGALVFLMLVALQFSVRLSKLTYRNKALSQRVALLEKELDDLRGERRSTEPRPQPLLDATSRSGPKSQTG